MEVAIGDIDGDQVPLFDDGQRPPLRGFRRNVAHEAAVVRPRKAPVRNQGGLQRQPLAEEEFHGHVHLPHSRPAFGPLVADHDDFSFRHFPVQDGLIGRFFAVEDARLPRKRLDFRADGGRLGDAGVRGQVSPEDGQPSSLGPRMRQGFDHAGVFDLGLRDIFGHGFSAHRQGVSMEERKDLFHDRRNAAREMKVGDVLGPRRKDFGDQGRGAAQLLEVVDGQVYIRFIGQRQHVQNGIGGPAHRGVETNGVFEAFPVDDLPGGEPLHDHAHDPAPRFLGGPQAIGVDGRDRGAPRQAQTEGFG